MTTRLVPGAMPLRDPPIGFGHRGARAVLPDNSLPGFELALRLGATGLETDAFVSSDGIALLDHDGVTRRGLRKIPLSQVRAADTALPSLADLYDLCGNDFELSIDIKDPAAMNAVATTAERYGALDRLWPCTPDQTAALEWAVAYPGCNVVHSTRRRALRRQEEAHAARMLAGGVRAVNLHHSDWTAGLVSLYHRFGLLCFGWDVQFPRVVDGLLAMGIDGLYSDHVDMLMDHLPPAPHP